MLRMTTQVEQRKRLALQMILHGEKPTVIHFYLFVLTGTMAKRKSKGNFNF